ncbi:MAG: ATP synthase F0 subunit B [Acidobacteriota bacterium]|nr:ATP synthase F0 subunit B [Acidobacteriota bacterium]
MKLSLRRGAIVLMAGGWLFAAVLVFGSFILVHAQETAQASQPAASGLSGQVASSEEAIGKQEAKSEGPDEDAFLKSPMVKTFAHMFHMDLKTASWVFEGLNSAILFLAIFIPLMRVLPKMLRKRSETLQADLIAAKKMTDEAGARLRAVEEKLSRLDGDVAAMRRQMEEESKQDEQRIKAAMVDETARVVAAAEQEIASAAVQARRGLQQFAADLSIEQATKQLKLTAETDKALIAEFVSGAGKAQGGKN